jgi:cytoskeletal protein RodZ
MSADMVDFGKYLQKQREARGLSVADISRATKIKERCLESLEAGTLGELPAPVFVRGFVTAYARAVGLEVAATLEKLRAAMPPDEPEVAVPSPNAPEKGFEIRTLFVRPSKEERERDKGLSSNRRLGVVMVVFLVLVVATLTLSLILGHGHRGDGLG